ncbi:MAG: hypothetical protein D6746_14560 [Bacteroidetes bacterium]|nr:MAG: hypothetical protein D6746_14560 [Bacteroidota bacterium]
MAYRAHDTARKKGWWPEGTNPIEKLALIVTEVSEAIEQARITDTRDYYKIKFGPEGQMFGIAEELADIIIRTLDFCAAYGIDIDKAVQRKMAYNESRPWRHGGKLA